MITGDFVCHLTIFIKKRKGGFSPLPLFSLKPSSPPPPFPPKREESKKTNIYICLVKQVNSSYINISPKSKKNLNFIFSIEKFSGIKNPTLFNANGIEIIPLAFTFNFS